MSLVTSCGDWRRGSRVFHKTTKNDGFNWFGPQNQGRTRCGRASKMKGTWRHREAYIKAKKSRESGISVWYSYKILNYFTPKGILRVCIVFRSYIYRAREAWNLNALPLPTGSSRIELHVKSREGGSYVNPFPRMPLVPSRFSHFGWIFGVLLFIGFERFCARFPRRDSC